MLNYYFKSVGIFAAENDAPTMDFGVNKKSKIYYNRWAYSPN